MTDKQLLPSVEPPPSTNVQQQGSPLASVLETAQSEGPLMTPPPSQPQPIQPSNPPPSFQKKGLPKVAIYALGVMALIIVVLVLMLVMRSFKGTNLIGTKGELTWWGMEETNVVQPLIEDFQRDNPNVRIKYMKQSPEDYRERLTNSLAGGQGPDIFEIHNSWGLMFKNELSVMPSNIMSVDEYKKTFYPVVSTDFINENGVVGIPLEYDALTLFINEDIFTSALKSPPKTWDEVVILAREMTQKGPTRLIIQSGVSLGLMENVDSWPEILALMMLQNGGNPAKPSDSVTKDVVNFYMSFFKVDKVWDSTMPRSTLAFAREKSGMYFGTSKNISEIVEENPSVRFRTVLLPQLPKERPSDPDISYATYWAHGVWERSANTDTAWSFLKFLASPESLQKLNANREANNLQEKVYPRTDMSIVQKEDEVLGSLVALAPVAKSWYLADKTFDGPTGINSQINKAYGDVLQASLDNQDVDRVIKALPAKINEIVAKFSSARR